MFAVTLAIFVCFVQVQSQSTIQTTAAAIPPQIVSALQTLHSDFKTSGNFDSVKVLADAQALANAIQANIQSAPQQVQDKFKQLQSQLQQLQASPTKDDHEIKKMIHTLFSVVGKLYPGGRKSMNPVNSPTPRTS